MKIDEDIEDAVTGLCRLVEGKNVITGRAMKAPKTRAKAEDVAQIVASDIVDPLAAHADKLYDAVNELVELLDEMRSACETLEGADTADDREEAFEALDESAHSVRTALRDFGMDVGL